MPIPAEMVVGGATLPSRSLRRIPLSYDNRCSEASAKELVYALRPEWREDAGAIEIVKFTDGITNTLLKVTKKTPDATVQQIEDDAVLMRAYGNNTDILIDRDREAQSHAALAERGLAPALLARFDNGLLYRYIQGQVCSPKDLTREEVWRKVARKLAEWHARMPLAGGDEMSYANGHAKCNGHPEKGIASRRPIPNIWSVMLKWIAALPSSSDKERARNELLRSEVERSFAELDSTDSLGQHGLVFAHCDLLSGNVIMLGTDVADVAFIDYEYATPSPAAFDIANHFAEWGGFDCDYNMLPTRSVRRAFLEEYLDAYSGFTAADARADVDRLFEEIDQQRGLPGLYWGIWALIQAKISQIDFDYASYAEVRLGEYWAWREATHGHRNGSEMPLRERRWAQTR